MAESILPAVKFKILTEQLTDNEFDKMLSNFRGRVGREEMLKLICQRSYYTHLSAMDEDISSIIQQRQ